MFIIVIPVQVLVIIPTDSSVTALPAEHVRAPPPKWPILCRVGR